MPCPPGSALPVVAGPIRFGSSLGALYLRRMPRRTVREASQFGSGLMFPVPILPHVAGARQAGTWLVSSGHGRP